MNKYRTERDYLGSTLLKDGDYGSIREMLERINRLIPGNQVLAELDQEKKIKY